MLRDELGKQVRLQGHSWQNSGRDNLHLPRVDWADQPRLPGAEWHYGSQWQPTDNQTQQRRKLHYCIAKLTTPNGRSIQFLYDSFYRVTTVTDNIGRQVQYSYDASGRLSTVTDANGGFWTYNYDSLNRMTTIEDPRQITYLTMFTTTTAGCNFITKRMEQVFINLTGRRRLTAGRHKRPSPYSQSGVTLRPMTSWHSVRALRARKALQDSWHKSV